MPRPFAKSFDVIEKALTALTAIMMVLLSIFIIYQVFSRYVLRSSPFWIEELTVVGLMWVGLLGAAGSVWTENHMGLEIFQSRLPAPVRLWVRIFCDLVLALFAFFLFVQGIKMVNILMDATLATLSLPLGYTYLIVPVSGLLMTLFALAKAVGRVLDHRATKAAGRVPDHRATKGGRAHA